MRAAPTFFSNLWAITAYKSTSVMSRHHHEGMFGGPAVTCDFFVSARPHVHTHTVQITSGCSELDHPGTPQFQWPALVSCGRNWRSSRFLPITSYRKRYSHVLRVIVLRSSIRLEWHAFLSTLHSQTWVCSSDIKFEPTCPAPIPKSDPAGFLTSLAWGCRIWPLPAISKTNGRIKPCEAAFESSLRHLTKAYLRF